ncbi:hypothetical protein EGW08_017587 [Elysia chlorotica]|uniref:OAR domain-containing protein n=1 Tax=Elysia chlorotica TaxID=188477 RepID=A0A3S0ZT59_ELYCH|nr:hypothetical protein EGW08_017587 [Elysia chlorotica]
MHLPTHLGTPLDPCRVSPFLGLPPFTTDRLERLPLAPPPPHHHHHAHQASHAPGPITSPQGPPHPHSPHPFYPYLPLHPGSAAVAAAMATHHALQPMLLFQQHLAALSASLHSSHAQSHAHLTPGPACSPLLLDRIPAGTIPMPPSSLLPTSLPTPGSSPSSPASIGSSSTQKHPHHPHHQLHNPHQGHALSAHPLPQQKTHVVDNGRKTPSKGLTPSTKPTAPTTTVKNTNLHTVERIMAPIPIPTTSAAKRTQSPGSPPDSSLLSPVLSQQHKHLHSPINSTSNSTSIGSIQELHQTHQYPHRSSQDSVQPILSSVRRSPSAPSPSSPRSSPTPPRSGSPVGSTISGRGLVSTGPASAGCGFKPSKTTSIADLRLKARQHLASLGI